jgi:hypothetical protein
MRDFGAEAAELAEKFCAVHAEDHLHGCKWRKQKLTSV